MIPMTKHSSLVNCAIQYDLKGENIDMLKLVIAKGAKASDFGTAASNPGHHRTFILSNALGCAGYHANAKALEYLMHQT